MFTSLPVWSIWTSLSLIGCLVAADELSYRLGLRVSADSRESLGALTGAAQAAALGMVALLLAFGLSMAESRFSLRRRLIVAEANAIGTTYLRAEFLSPPAAQELRTLLVAYADARVAFYNAAAEAPSIEAADSRSEALQRQMWDRIATEVRTTPSSTLAALLVATMNDTIDRAGDRRAALEDHVPPTFLVVLFLASLIACGATGYACGLRRRRHILSSAMVPMLLAIGIGTLVDLDRPRVGLIRTGQGAMLRLQTSLHRDAAGAHREN